MRVGQFLALLLAAASSSAFYSSASAQTAALSVPTAADADPSSPRASAIAALAAKIKNERRSVRIAGQDFPLYTGPVGELTATVQLQEYAVLINFRTDVPANASALLAQQAPQFTRIEQYAQFYDSITNMIEKPMAAHNDDVTFGAQRLSIKGFNMRAVRTNELALSDTQLSTAQRTALCGSPNAARFVSEFRDVEQFNDPLQRHRKYVPNVVGEFCFHARKQQLLPLAIRVLATNLTYTPLDAADEWTLAKMALEASEIDWQEFQHMAETHAVTIPIRVEMYRHLAAQHPVSALLRHHTFADFALELQALRVLLNTSTEVDTTFGFGATGSARFLDHQLHATGGISVMTDFPTELKARGIALDAIPTHKYARYGLMYHAAFVRFVAAFVDAFYADDEAVQRDAELQAWAAASAAIPHVRDFPRAFASKAQLAALLSNLVFQSTVRHHMMNGFSTWHAMAVPYSVNALWHALPTRKLAPGETLDLLAYTTPAAVAPDQVRLAALFYRMLPENNSLALTYDAAPFNAEAALGPAIADFNMDMDVIDAEVAAAERRATQPWPWHLMQSRWLSYYTWV